MAPGREDRSAARRRVDDYLHERAPEARRPAVDALIWMTSDRVEGAAQILLDDGDEQVDLVAGSGPASVVLHTNAVTLLEVAMDPRRLDEARQRGQWTIEGPPEDVARFEASFAGALTEDDDAS